jgi:hypothetical protein
MQYLETINMRGKDLKAVNIFLFSNPATVFKHKQNTVELGYNVIKGT